MALADVLRERVSRRGRTAEVACGLLGTVTVEALPPRECAALGLRDGGRALLYAACRDLQTAGETLRREGRLFTPAEVTAYVSEEEAAAAARTVLALSGVTTDGDGASTKSAEVRLGDVQNNGTHLAVEAPSGEEIRLGDVRKPDGTAEDGQVSHEFFGGDGSDRTDPILGGVSDFVPQNLALSEENDRFSAPLEVSGNAGEVSGRGSNLHEKKSEAGEAVHEMKSDSTAERREGLHESKSEVEEAVHETRTEFAAARREGLHESKSEVGEMLHEMKSESVERFAEGLLEGLRRAAAVR